MASTLTDRVSGALGGAVSSNGYGIIPVSGVAGTDTVTGTCTPTIAGYVANRYFSIRPVNLNTGAVDVNFDSSGLVSLLSPGGAELTAGQFDPAYEYIIKFNGTDFRIISPSF